jgi:hypothetical protein
VHLRVIRPAAVCLVMTAALVGMVSGTAHAGGTGAANRPAVAAVSGAASAVVEDDRAWSVPNRRLYQHPWYLGGGGCYAGSNASYDDATRTLTVIARASSTSVLAGCYAGVRLGVQVFDWSEEQLVVKPIVRDIPTACSTTDPTCPSATEVQFAVELGDEEQLLHVIDYDVVRR